MRAGQPVTAPTGGSGIPVVRRKVPVSLGAVIVAAAGIMLVQITFASVSGSAIWGNMLRPFQDQGWEAALLVAPLLSLFVIAAILNAAHFAALYILPAHALLAHIHVTSYSAYATATAVSGVLIEAFSTRLNLFPVGGSWLLPPLMGAFAGVLYRWSAGLRSNPDAPARSAA
jgi:hypothetical protein